MRCRGSATRDQDNRRIYRAGQDLFRKVRPDRPNPLGRHLVVSAKRVSSFEESEGVLVVKPTTLARRRKGQAWAVRTRRARRGLRPDPARRHRVRPAPGCIAPGLRPRDLSTGPWTRSLRCRRSPPRRSRSRAARDPRVHPGRATAATPSPCGASNLSVRPNSRRSSVTFSTAWTTTDAADRYHTSRISKPARRDSA